jgi:alginate O-acetyltransferase complex protein AlgI
MLFNSIECIFVFLPSVALGYFVLGKRSPNAAIVWLAAASLAFYAWWDPRYLTLLVGSVVFNYLIGRRIGAGRYTALWLALGIVTNLCLLGYYKYANFFLDNLALVSGYAFSVDRIILPLGISFFTFTQIAYLVDVWRNEAREYHFTKYLLFATFFPHLIAGPILHHKEIMPQFDDAQTFRVNWERIAEGLSFFALGLAKKILLADNIAPYATDVFEAARMGSVSFLEAWQGSLSYTLQLYFDFSGYCDMAIGAALLFGIRMPVNFASPYKSLSIIEFWRTWHMTLARFLRDYLYIPLGGNRAGELRRYLNLIIVMLLGGLWHGAGWTFVVWGGLHGMYLLINHAWRSAFRPSAPNIALNAAYWVLTFICVVFAWVFFRADSLQTAINMMYGMLGLQGFVLELNYRAYFGPLAHWLEALGFTFAPATQMRVAALPWILGLLAVCLALPNSQQWIWDKKPLLAVKQFGLLCWRPTTVYGLTLGALATYAISKIGQPSEFLYFNF